LSDATTCYANFKAICDLAEDVLLQTFWTL